MSTNGKWESIDNSLSLDASGNYTNKANRFKVSLPKADNGTFSLNDGDYGISWKINNASSVSDINLPVTNSQGTKYNDASNIIEKASYESVFNHVDMANNVMGNGVTEISCRIAPK